MNVFQLSPYDAFPPTCGGDHRTHGLVSAFPDFGDTVYRYCQRGVLVRLYQAAVDGDARSSLGAKVRTRIEVESDYVEVRALNPYYDLASLPALFDYPHVLLSTANIVRLPRAVHDRIEWADVVLVERPWHVPAVAAAAADTPVVYSSHDAVSELYATRADGLLGRWFYSKAVETERTAIRVADLVVCTSKRDKRNLESEYDPTTRLIVAPNSIWQRDLSPPESVHEGAGSSAAERQFRQAHGIDEDSSVCLFVGGRHPPNVDGANAIVDIATGSRDADRDVHFLIVGPVGDALDGTPPNVTTTGFVDDLSPYYECSDIALNPVTWGSGSNVKVFEYFANRIPVVSTAFGVRGLDVTAGEHVRIADIDGFGDAIASLADDSLERRRLSRNAAEFIREVHTWESVSAELRGELESLLAAHGRTADADVR